MALYFVTGNPGKLLEAQRALGRFGVEVRGAKADFDEPRSDDLAQIARAKVRQAPGSSSTRCAAFRGRM